MTRRTLSVLLALCMLLGLLPFGVFAAQEDFSDVPADAWYAADVAYAAEHGLMNGVGDGRFDPDGTTTRAMLVTILHRLEGTPAAAKSAFSDVPAGAWYTAAVDWAAANKIVEGMNAATFAPDSPVTREQFAVILWRYANFKGMDTAQKADLSAFSDAASVSAWAADAMAWANAAGLINGVSKTELQPQGSATRAQAAAILGRFDRMVKAAEAKPGKVTLTVNKTEATVTEPRQTFTGAYTVENDRIDRVDWVQHSDVEAYEGVTGTAMIDQTRGTWEAADILLAPGANTITFTAYTKNGASAEQTVEITYDSGVLAGYTRGDITYLDDKGNGYVNNVIVLMLDTEASAKAREAALQAACAAVGGEIIGQLNDCDLYQIRVAQGDWDALWALCRKAEGVSDVILSAFVDRVYPSPETPITGVLEDGTEMIPGADTLSVPDRDMVIPNDTWDNSIWSTTTPTDWNMDDPYGSNWWAEAIRAPAAWAYDEYFTNTIRVGIADSGLSTTHEDLTITRTLNSTNVFGHHGTHVAGLIGATANNGKGMTGVAWNKAELYGYDLFGSSSSTSDTIMMAGVRKLVENGCKVVNMSVGMSFDSPAELEDSSYTTEYTQLINSTLRNYDFLVFQSAGNGFSYVENGTDYSDFGFDAKYNGGFCAVTNGSAKEHIVVVACAMSPRQSQSDHFQLTGWSCYGDTVTIASPGLYCYSTVYYDKGYYKTTTEYNNSDVKNTNGYVDMSGTSMASPIAAGSAALVWSVNPDLKAKEIKQILLDTAGVCYRNDNNTTQRSMRNGYYTYYYGLDSRETYPFLNVEAAVEEALDRTYGDGTLNVSFVSAKDRQPVNNVAYEIRLGSPDGDVVAFGTANGSERIKLPRAQGTDYHQAQYYLVATGNFTNYVSSPFTIDVGGTRDLTAALNVPEAPQAQSYRIVLTWNAEPADLDAHLFCNDGHVYYKQHSIDHARMDLDDTQSFGPETITVDDVTALGGFTYAVHDFTNRATFSNASGLASSGATVRVYAGNALVKTYTVPTNMLGTVWNVFSVDADGTITDGGATEQYFAYSGNGEAIPGLFRTGASPQSAAWQTVAPKKH